VTPTMRAVSPKSDATIADIALPAAHEPGWGRAIMRGSQR
jgi:hypothetical protein